MPESPHGRGRDHLRSRWWPDELAPWTGSRRARRRAASSAPVPSRRGSSTSTAVSDVAQPPVAVASSYLGDIVVDGQGRTLYMFLPDQADVPTCTDDCVATWPVFEGPATAGDGVDAALLSTVAHPSGVTQVTYGGWPLYAFVDDTAPSDVNGQGVNGIWSAIGPNGEPVDET